MTSTLAGDAASHVVSADGDEGVQVRYVDAWLIAVDKPAGQLAVPGRGADKADCTATRVVQRWPDARVVHRLDMATSGLLLFARGAAMQRALSQAFEARAVDKRYLAQVHGLVHAGQGEIDLPLGPDWPRRPRQRVDSAGGRPSLTRWRVLARDLERRTTRLELQPLTGRTHQLRVHLSAIGHAIVGDRLYPQPDRSAQGDGDAHDDAPRLMLHAASLAFAHPASGRRLELEAAAPF